MVRITPPWQEEYQTLVKSDDQTDPNYGCRPSDRSAQEHIRYGIINLDKTAGPTSHEVAAWVKRILKVKRIGHGGTLEA
jgi:H/ACA ribonucleoprotein complex subunit 4